MILNLNFDIEFATGKRFSGKHDFESGLSAITGRNEAGKSLRVEMIRYCLFGSEALRAEAKNYTSIKAYMSFKVGEETYTVTRAGKSSKLTKGDENIATGTSPVNDAILKLLGYDLEVFDVANACLQGEIEAMTNKRPAERKQMVDRTIGLDGIDQVITKVNSDMSATKKAIETLNEQVIQIYEQPVVPDGLVDGDTLESLEERQEKLEELSKRKSYLSGLLDSAKVEAPQPLVIQDEIHETLEILQGNLNELEVEAAGLGETRSTLDAFNIALNAIDGRDTGKIKEFLENKYDEKWAAYTKYEDSRVTDPGFTEEDLDEIDKGNLIKDEESDIHVVDCPSCHHKFDLNGGKLVVHNFSKYDEAVKRVGGKDTKTIRNARNLLNAWEKFKALTPVEKPDMDRSFNLPGLVPHIETLERLSEFNAVEAADLLKNFSTNYKLRKDNLNERISAKKKQESIRATHKAQTEAHDKYIALRASHGQELERLKDIELEAVSVKERYNKLRAYHDAVVKYEARQEAQAEALRAKATLELNMELLARVRKALNELKPKVKLYLLPSLNAVASELLSQMTGGERTKIVVDENFEIAVDDQPVKTLSGSGKAVANLAVRIALGMVLTNKVFSVFLADEIDAAMDDERAEYTAQCLRNLTKTIGQIILVSHKQPDADHQIEL